MLAKHYIDCGSLKNDYEYSNISADPYSSDGCAGVGGIPKSVSFTMDGGKPSK